MRIVQVFGFLIVLWSNRSNAAPDYDIMIAQGCKNLESTSAMLRLKRHLFCEYDPTVRPTTSHQTVNNVTIKLVPMLLDFDQWTSTMGLHSWMTLTWTDEHLTWTPSDFDGITVIHVKSTDLWVPDLSVYNSGDMSLDQTGIPSTNCLVYNTGTVTCIPSVKHITRCATDFTRWPYDKHHCRINFGSWIHSGEEVNFYLSKKGYDMDGYRNNTEWDLQIVNAYKVLQKFKCCPNDTYPLIVYDFTITRHHGIMQTTFMTPAVAMMLLTLTVLWLDSRSIERMAVGSVNIICHLLCMFDLYWELPHNGLNPPSILLFYRDSLALATFALILTAVLRKLQDMSIVVPYWISTATAFVLSNKVGRFLILTDDDAKMSSAGIFSNEGEDNSDLPAARNSESSWRHFTAIIEWLSFVCVVFTYIIILTILVPFA